MAILGVVMNSILMIDDDEKLLTTMGIHLSRMGLELETSTDGAKGLEMAINGDYSLVIIDGNLPSLDGFEVCQRLREKNQSIPIVMLTSRAEEVDTVVGLESGADDYITKPFQLAELEARIRALLRRVNLADGKSNASQDDLVRHGQMSIDQKKREISIGGRKVEVTPLEFDLLLFFALNPGQVFSRLQLLNNVWGTSYEGYEHSVNLAVSRLRSKIAIYSEGAEYILTARGVGYRFATEDELEARS